MLPPLTIQRIKGINPKHHKSQPLHTDYNINANHESSSSFFSETTYGLTLLVIPRGLLTMQKRIPTPVIQISFAQQLVCR